MQKKMNLSEDKMAEYQVKSREEKWALIKDEVRMSENEGDFFVHEKYLLIIGFSLSPPLTPSPTP